MYASTFQKVHLPPADGQTKVSDKRRRTTLVKMHVVIDMSYSLKNVHATTGGERRVPISDRSSTHNFGDHEIK
jgi:hypothetical protein